MTKAKVVLIVLSILVAGMVAAQERAESVVVDSLEALSYPPLARRARLEGRGVVQVKLDEAGRVVSATLPDGKIARLMMPDVLSNARKWRFRPNAEKAATIVYDFHIVDECSESDTPSRFVFQAPNTAVITACPLPIERSSK